MRMTTLVIVCVFSSLMCSLTAQKKVPGYLGNRLSANVDVALHPLRLDFAFGGRLGYAMSRRVEFTTDYSIMTGDDNTRNSYSYSFENGGRLKIEREVESHNIRRLAFGLNIYLNDHLAPVGRHIRFSIASLSIDPGEVMLVEFDEQNSSVEVGRKSIDQSFGLTGIEIGYYDRNIISGNFVMDYGLTASYLARGKYGGRFFAPGRRQNYSDRGRTDFIANTYPREVGFDIQMSQLLVFELGFGILF